MIIQINFVLTHQGSVLVKRDVDIKDTYFSVTNDVYDPYAALEFISSAYNSYKNRVIGIVEEMLNEPVLRN